MSFIRNIYSKYKKKIRENKHQANKHQTNIKQTEMSRKTNQSYQYDLCRWKREQFFERN